MIDFNHERRGIIKPSFVGPHEGRELMLMRSGAKYLSMFVVEDDSEVELFPEGEFDDLVRIGKLVKHVQLERITNNISGTQDVRRILYASVGEEWRIYAMLFIQGIYKSHMSGWHPDIERIIGYLLGYDSVDIESFIERLSSRHPRPTSQS